MDGGVSAFASVTSDLRGLLAIDGAAPNLIDLALDIRMVTPSPDDRAAAIARRAEHDHPHHQHVGW